MMLISEKKRDELTNDELIVKKMIDEEDISFFP